MRSLRVVLPFVIATAAGISLPRDAHAGCCFATAASAINFGSSPLAVPTNALIRIDYTLHTNQSCVAGTNEILEQGCCRQVVDSQGAEVPGQWTVVPSEVGHFTVLFEPAAEYAPLQTYGVTDQTSACWESGATEPPATCETDTAVPFTTAEGRDTTGPSLGGEPVVECRTFAFERGAQCDVVPDEIIVAEGFEFSVTGVTADDPALAGLRLQVRTPDGTPVSDEHAGPLAFVRRRDCSCGGDQPETRLPADDGDYLLAVYAEDIAGNRSADERVVPWSRQDCPFEDETSGGTGGSSPSAEPLTEEAGGCTLATARPQGPVAALLLAVLVLACSRSRRRES